MERLDAKARQPFALVAAFFAVVSTVAVGAFAQAGGGAVERVLLAVLAVSAGISVGVVGHRLRNEEDLQFERDLDPDKILEWWDKRTEKDEVSVNLATGLAEIAKDRSITSGELRCIKSLTTRHGSR